MIQQLNETTYTLTARGNEMTLRRYKDGWEMYTVNATVRAYNRGHPIPKYFPTLKAVEAKYKTWRGIVQLVDNEVTAA